MATKKLRRIEINEPSSNYFKIFNIQLRKKDISNLIYFTIRIVLLVIIPLLLVITSLTITIMSLQPSL